MIDRKKIEETAKGYGKPAIATICSHSSLQIFHGAKAEGLRTIGICVKGRENIYDAFPLAKPDEFIFVDSYSSIPSSELLARNAVLVPHGSFVEYMGEKLDNLPVPVLGNRSSLVWERSREKMFEWMNAAGLRTPKVISSPREIDRPCIVKFQGAKGGRGYVVADSPEQYAQKVGSRPAMVQEFLTGVRAYPHYFYSPLDRNGYAACSGHVELLGVDRRVESNADEIGRSLHARANVPMGFTVVANEPLVLRESLLHEYLEIGRNVSQAAEKLFGGIPGPFCVETMITQEMEIYAFEISARIVAGTNIFADSSPYSVFLDKKPLSMGRRIAIEVKKAAKMKRLHEIVY